MRLLQVVVTVVACSLSKMKYKTFVPRLTRVPRTEPL